MLQSVLSVHDTVAQKKYDPELPPLPEDIDDDEDSVKIIRLVKNKEPLVRKFEFPLSVKANVYKNTDKFLSDFKLNGKSSKCLRTLKFKGIFPSFHLFLYQCIPTEMM